jgi:hypothetical protein
MPPPKVKAAAAKAETVVEFQPAAPVVEVPPPVVEVPEQEPKMDPMAGIKTPAYRAWLQRYRPEEYRKKFGEE